MQRAWQHWRLSTKWHAGGGDISWLGRFRSALGVFRAWTVWNVIWSSSVLSLVVWDPEEQVLIVGVWSRIANPQGKHVSVTKLAQNSWESEQRYFWSGVVGNLPSIWLHNFDCIKFTQNISLDWGGEMRWEDRKGENCPEGADINSFHSS